MSSPALAEVPVPARRWLAVGSSGLPDSRAAGLEAASAALTQPDAQLLLVFYSDSHDVAALAAAISEVAGAVPVVGCSTTAEISPSGPASDSVVITALGGSGFSVSTTLARQAGSYPRAAGAKAAECVASVQHRPHTVLMLLTDGLITSQDEILRGVYGVLGAGVPLVGGCAADRQRIRTTQLFGTEAADDAVIGIAIGSDSPIGIGINHGWRKVGDAMAVTSADRGWIHTLDDEPALDAYLQRLDAPAAAYHDYGAFEDFIDRRPLGIPRRHGFEVRGVTERPNFATRSLGCSAEIAQGSLVWCMEGDIATMLTATDDACAAALEALGPQPPLGLVVFDCSGRRAVLGHDGSVEEVRRVAAHASTAPFAGFYTFGEIARTHGVNGFHHQTLVVLALG